ncbi:MAG: hypothetical protein EPN69_09365 [Rhodanobacter sp.]|nr:MAG: hypothetical protein EPN69_09365 [Rhodanobacter sp.]TAM05238.1 MAG: hypothetical protein EPN71_02065 [Rhodanobacter sp.]TAM42540.1 MAG: hypothetical protein EPN58_02690 [Rhodanobacter sp.]TAN26197.1 MAG: hypothetical protein EPN32_07890 [Rhodanobacter sp.]
MNAYKLIAGAAAVLFTVASLSAVTCNVRIPPADGSQHAIKVTNLAPVIVHPGAAERRAAALLSNHGKLASVTLSAGADTCGNAVLQPLGALGSQLVMPYYSFGKKFARITKE